MNNIIYTVAFDEGPVPYHRWMAMLLISSLQRSGYAGKVLLFTDTEAQPFSIGRLNVEQVRVELTAAQRAAHAVYRVKYLVVDLLPADADWLMYADPDILMLRNPEEALTGEATVLYAEEPWSTVADEQNNAYLTDEEMKTQRHPAVNAGVYAHRGSVLRDFIAIWKAHDESPPLRPNHAQDQPPFVRTLLDWPHLARPFREPFAVRYPEYEDVRLSGLFQAGLLHFNGVQAPEKFRRMLGFYTMLHGQSLAPFLLEMLQG